MKKTSIYLFKIIILILLQSFTTYSQSRIDAGSAHLWKQCKPIPVAMSPSSVRIGDKIYLLGLSLYVYDVKQNNWKEKTKMSVSRDDFSMVSLNGKIYVLGGIPNSSKIPTSLVEEYDPVKDKWQVKSPLLNARSGMGICIYNDKIYTFGGYIHDDVETDILEVYDPKTDKWTRQSSIPQQTAYNTPILINNTMYMGYKNGFYKYNPESDKWTITTSSHKINNCLTMVTTLANDKIYAICGEFINRKGIASHLVKYDPVSDTWEHLNDPSHFRMDFRIIELQGKIYVFGGWSEDYRKALKSCEMYDIETNTWEQLPEMSVPRVGMGIQIFNNSVFVFGGMSGFDDDLNKRMLYSNVEVLPIMDSSINKPKSNNKRAFFLFKKNNNKLK